MGLSSPFVHLVSYNVKNEIVVEIVIIVPVNVDTDSVEVIVIPLKYIFKLPLFFTCLVVLK